jgi:hypothetical protein
MVPHFGRLSTFSTRTLHQYENDMINWYHLFPTPFNLSWTSLFTLFSRRKNKQNNETNVFPCVTRLWIFFKVIFILKYIKIIFFLFF